MLKQIRNLATRLFSPTVSQEAPRERLYPDERACAVAVLSNKAVQALYRTLNVDPAVVQARVDTLPEGVTNPDAEQVLEAGSLWHQHMARLTTPIELELCLLSGLIIHGSAEVRNALALPPGMPGDIPFLIAHKRPEAELQSAWPSASEQTGHVVMLNDLFTPMEIVVGALETSFSLSRDSAIAKMLDVHKAGAAWIERKAGSNAAEICTRLNAEWRALGLPLYCEPQLRTIRSANV